MRPFVWPTLLPRCLWQARTCATFATSATIATISAIARDDSLRETTLPERRSGGVGPRCRWFSMRPSLRHHGLPHRCTSRNDGETELCAPRLEHRQQVLCSYLLLGRLPIWCQMQRHQRHLLVPDVGRHESPNVGTELSRDHRVSAEEAICWPTAPVCGLHHNGPQIWRLLSVACLRQLDLEGRIRIRIRPTASVHREKLRSSGIL